MTEIGPGPGDRPMISPQHPRPQLGHPPERLASLVTVAQFLGHHAQIVRDLKNQRIRVAEPKLPRRIGFLEHPPGSHRFVRLLQNRPELIGSGKNVRIILR